MSWRRYGSPRHRRAQLRTNLINSSRTTSRTSKMLLVITNRSTRKMSAGCWTRIGTPGRTIWKRHNSCSVDRSHSIWYLSSRTRRTGCRYSGRNGRKPGWRGARGSMWKALEALISNTNIIKIQTNLTPKSSSWRRSWQITTKMILECPRQCRGRNSLKWAYPELTDTTRGFPWENNQN